MAELESFIVSNPDPRELKRALAVSMTLRGYKHEAIMAILQISSGFISNSFNPYSAICPTNDRENCYGKDIY